MKFVKKWGELNIPEDVVSTFVGPVRTLGLSVVGCKVVGGSPMLFWLVDGVVSSIVEIWVLGRWTKTMKRLFV